MKHSVITVLAIVALGVVLSPALAEDQPSRKGPPVTMGNDGKLPATDSVSRSVPEIGATGSSSGESGTASASPKGPPQTMGSDGKLPATDAMSGAAPQMTGRDGSGN